MAVFFCFCLQHLYKTFCATDQHTKNILNINRLFFKMCQKPLGSHTDILVTNFGECSFVPQYSKNLLRLLYSASQLPQQHYCQHSPHSYRAYTSIFL